ncbi:hypothetical protein D0962_12885 [Leptolyngbyaceae cyanobacterium CCMR0082]|uniref:Uncharacterized protein n=1 Tax=Adonisia turfae CCMR0082 TaxID=2304604 RepID=A0A6M0S5C2_9CYAN|nr:hypothetical protein [Adonisia turfae]MDV3353399.1 hypothetical protein [Leptothoe sp. LEGE 181152]NEZ63667.1 hypothetical protein [Adonisia turfae CCMR0082]
MNSDNVQLFRMLIEAGAQPGEDFSYDLSQGTCHINERGFILLQTAFPDINWHEISNVIERDLDSPVQRLNQHLGVDFLATLLQKLQKRLEQLPTNEAAWYMHQVLGGIEQRTGIALYQIIQRDLPPAICQQLDQLLKLTPLTPCNLWIEDLVIAAGGAAQDIDYEGGDVLLSEAGVELLTQVWTGELEVQDDLAA